MGDWCSVGTNLVILWKSTLTKSMLSKVDKLLKPMLTNVTAPATIMPIWASMLNKWKTCQTSWSTIAVFVNLCLLCCADDDSRYLSSSPNVEGRCKMWTVIDWCDINIEEWRFYRLCGGKRERGGASRSPPHYIDLWLAQNMEILLFYTKESRWRTANRWHICTILASWHISDARCGTSRLTQLTRGEYRRGLGDCRSISGRRIWSHEMISLLFCYI